MTDVPHVPVLRAGRAYESLDTVDVRSHRDGRLLAQVGQANAGILRRDLKRMPEHAAALREVGTARMLEIAREAGRLFLHETLPLGGPDGAAQSPDDYVAMLSETSGLPHVLCRRNMQKVFTVFDSMPDILRGLMRGMDLGVVDRHLGAHAGVPVCYGPTTDSLGVVLPSNSPGVNSIWMPAVALCVPVVLKPGREEPWTPMRIIQAFLAAGCPPAAFGFYPTSHEGAGAILELCGRACLFGDESTTAPYAGRTAVNVHGPGRSKVVLGADVVDDWRAHLDVLVGSVVDNGGRSCINASSIFVPRHADAIADALAAELGAIRPTASDDPAARLSAIANPKYAEFVDATIERGLAGGGATDVTAAHRAGPRHVERDGSHFLLPTVVRCDSVEHALARTEFMFPFVSVVEVPPERLVADLGPSLVVTAITRAPELVDALLGSTDVDRVNLGPVRTSHVEWDQPHEGNLFEFLYARRAFQRTDGW